MIVSVSRLVPRKGMDVLIDARRGSRPTHPGLCVAIGGTGRSHDDLAKRIATTGAPVRLLGRVEARRPACALRLRRRVRHAVPQPLARPRAGGVRDRVPRGRRRRRAAGGRRQRGSGGGGGRRRHRATWCATRTTPQRWPSGSARSSTTPPVGRAWARPVGAARGRGPVLRRAGPSPGSGVGDMGGWPPCLSSTTTDSPGDGLINLDLRGNGGAGRHERRRLGAARPVRRRARGAVGRAVRDRHRRLALGLRARRVPEPGRGRHPARPVLPRRRRRAAGHQPAVPDRVRRGDRRRGRGGVDPPVHQRRVRRARPDVRPRAHVGVGRSPRLLRGPGRRPRRTRRRSPDAP